MITTNDIPTSTAPPTAETYMNGLFSVTWYTLRDEPAVFFSLPPSHDLAIHLNLSTKHVYATSLAPGRI